MAMAEIAWRTVGELYEDCRRTSNGDRPPSSKKEIANAGHCIGYFSGWLHAAGVLAERDKVKFCLPQEDHKTTAGQLIAVFLKWAKAHPELWHHHMAQGPITALLRTFPCKK
jgi:hypothetical protein